MWQRFPKTRTGAGNQLIMVVLVAFAALAVAGWLLYDLSNSGNTKPGDSSSKNDEPLFVYCAAGIRPAVAAIAKQYEEEFGVAVELQYGGSNTLLSQIEAAGIGDCFVAADESYIQRGREKGLVKEAIPLAWQEPVIAVSKGNPKSISEIADLLTDDVSTALGNTEQAAIGKVAKRLLTASGHWEQLEKHVTETGVFKPTVPEVANDVKIGSVDAGIIWDATAVNFGFDIVRTPELGKGKSKVQISVLKSSKQPTRALHFCRFAGARDKGLKIFKGNGFTPVDGDDWADKPEMVFYCGSVNRRAIEPVLKEFEQREGVSITTIYNGCGILSGQMKAIARGDMSDAFPDVYMACDVFYMDAVDEMFQDKVNVSETEVVLAVQKGNPKNIKSIQDLTKPGMRVSIGQPDQCTIGILSKQVLESAGIYDDVMENVQTEVITSSMLLPTVTTQSVDVTMAYASDTQFETERIDVVRIDLPAAKAVQPFGIARASAQKHLSRRLFEAVASSKAAFEDAGFQWLTDGRKTAAGAE